MNLIVIPAYNEEKHIGTVLERAKKYVDKLIVIDDGSKDRTSAVAKGTGVEVITLEKNGGKTNAVIVGINKALEYNPDIIVLMDSDGQHLPEEISRLIEPIEREGYDVASGYRSSKDKPFFRRIGGKIADFLMGGKDILCGFKAFRTEALKKINLSDAQRGYGYLLETVIHDEIKRNHLKIKYVPISTIYSDEIVSKISFIKGGINYLKYRLRKLIK